MRNFLDDYGYQIGYLVICIFGIFVLCYTIFGFDKALTQEKQIIENTKDFEIFDYCRKIENKFYCWN